MSNPAAGTIDPSEALVDAVSKGIQPMHGLMAGLAVALVVQAFLIVILTRIMPKSFARKSSTLATMPPVLAFSVSHFSASAAGPLWAAAGLSVLMAVAIAILGWKQATIRGAVGERRLQKHITGVGFPVITDVYLPAKSGLTQIDQIVRAGDMIVVVEVKNYSGNIQASERSANWTVWYGSTRKVMQNPIRQNYGHLMSVRAAIGKESVIGIVVFVGSARFKGQRPDGVFLDSELRGYLRSMAMANPPTREGLERWNRLVRLGEEGRTKDNKTTHLAQVTKRSADTESARIEPRF